MAEREASTPAESVCHRLGDLMASADPNESRVQEARQWAPIESMLDKRSCGRSMRRLWPVLAFPVALLVCVGGWLAVRRPLGYRLESCTPSGDGKLTAAGRGTIAFEDGTRIDLGKGAQVRMQPLTFARGAELTLDDGDLRVAVVHRLGTRWAVLAGPFRIDVSGTRFRVNWSRQRGRFRISMLEGEVRVSGGLLSGATSLRARQTMQVDLSQPAVAVTEDRNEDVEPLHDRPQAAAHPVHGPVALASATSTSSAGAWSQATVSSTHRRTTSNSDSTTGWQPTNPQGSALAETEPSDSVEALVPSESTRVVKGWTQPLSAGPSLPQPITPPNMNSSPAAITVPSKPEPRWVSFGDDGQLSGGITGIAWLASGDGTKLSTPATPAERAHLRPHLGELCASGTVAALSCVNEGTSRARCNWKRNWGVSIGFHTKVDQKAWGEAAASGIAIAFHGRSASYQLNAHRKGDPKDEVFCVNKYKSGQIARPSMFKSQCWADAGEPLSDFKDVDHFNLQFPSGMDYVAFHYCISGIDIYP